MRPIEKEIESRIAKYYRLLRFLRKHNVPEGLNDEEFQKLKQAYTEADEAKVKAFYRDEPLSLLRIQAAEKGIEYASILPKDVLLEKLK